MPTQAGVSLGLMAEGKVSKVTLQTPPTMTVEAFDEYALLPENRARLLEFIAGEIVEVVANNNSSGIAANVLGFLKMYLIQHPIGLVTGADGGYKIGNERYIPDVAVVLKTKQPKRSKEAYNSIPPDLVVEVMSPANTEQEIRVKVVNYLEAGCIVWVVLPDKEEVEVYVPHQPPKILKNEDTLDGGTLLPHFTLAIKTIFED